MPPTASLHGVPQDAGRPSQAGHLHYCVRRQVGAVDAALPALDCVEQVDRFLLAGVVYGVGPCGGNGTVRARARGGPPCKAAANTDKDGCGKSGVKSRGPLAIRIELPVIEDLGIKLYGKLPPVISEMVANAWDADADRVDITLPEGTMADGSAIVISDNGNGMSYDDMADKYLRIGRKRRDEDGCDRTPGGRRVMGRKGIGKLSVFGIARNVEVSTVRDGRKNTIVMNIDRMLKHAGGGRNYEPEVVDDDEHTGDANGTRITLTGLKRRTPVNVESVRRDLSKHFSIICDDFKVAVNGAGITAGDKFRCDDVERTWDIDAERVAPDDGPSNWTVSGRIYAMKSMLSAEDVGIRIMARGKLVQKNTTFGVRQGGKHAYSYITGEVAADFFDEDEDLISTNRQDVMWESGRGEALQEWGRKKLMEVSNELSADRKKRDERPVREDPAVARWLKGLVPAEKKTADKIIGIVSHRNGLDHERRMEIMEYVRGSFEEQAFKEMVVDLEDEPGSAKILDMFKTWNLIEAREMLRIVRGRLAAIAKLAHLVDQNAREVPDMHRYFLESPWVLDPTWTHYQHEVRYSRILSDKYPDRDLDEKDRRMDLLAVGIGNTLHVVELKRPGHSVSVEDMNQLFEYVRFVKSMMGSHPDDPYDDVTGHLVAGRIPEGAVREMVDEAKAYKRYARTYEDLMARARKIHEDFEKKLARMDDERCGAG